MKSNSVFAAVTAGANTRRERRPTVVIADRGNEAWLVVLDASPAPRLGSRFSHRGLVWEIVAQREASKTFVAAPVEH